MQAIRLIILITLGIAFTWIGNVDAEDWSRFRGPNGTGISSDEVSTPIEFSATKNLKWKAELPGSGVSSPIVVGDRVFVTCYSGYGLDAEQPGDQQNLKRHLVCFERANGEQIWNKTIDPVLPEDPYSGSGVPQHGYASHTPVSDGQNVYAFFGKSGAIAFDMDGNQLWQASVGVESDPRRWGSASSPILFENLLIVPAIAESESMVALDKKTGEEVWRQEAGGFAASWSTPILVKVNEQRTDLVIGVPDEIWGLNPKNGKMRWYCTGISSDQFNSSVVASNGVIYAIEGRRGGSVAVRAGGKGDVTKTHVVWTGEDRGRFGSPIVHNDRLFHVSNGIANVLNAKTGEKIAQSRLEGNAAANTTTDSGQNQNQGKVENPRPTPRGAAGGQQTDRRGGDRRSGRGRDIVDRSGGGDFNIPGRGRFRRSFANIDYSSPVMVDGKIYFVRRNGEIFVLSADDEIKQLAANLVTIDREDFSATPAISNGQIFVRSNKHLYCIESASDGG